MKTRGEKQYINIPKFIAQLYDNLTNVKGVNKSFEEIALFLKDQLIGRKILDIGTGPGRLLLEINKKIPSANLYGLDISAGMLEVARKNLSYIEHVDLRVGNIIKTDFPADFFDCIVSTGSFYNWDKPIDGLNEIYRILKPGQTAFIFDTLKNYDGKLLKTRLDQNLKGYLFIRKSLSKYFLKKQLSMTYTIDEYHDILKQSAFGNSYQVETTELGNLPVYVRLELKK